MADQELDRNESATPHKLEKAREKGQTARSTEIVGAAVFLAGMAYLTWHGFDAVVAVLRQSGAILAQAGHPDADGSATWRLVVDATGAVAGVMLPFLVVVALAAVAGSVVQNGFVFSLAPLQADFSRINPAAGIKRLFSLRTLFDGAKACLKLLVLATVAWFALRTLPGQFHQIASLTPGAFLHLLVQDIGAVGMKMALALGVLAFADLAYTRAEFGRRMRMSRRELKDEHKNREGDPRIRGRLRELRREMLKRSLALKNTRTADVVLTNPTHYAVALRYVHGEMDAPRVVAKGAGQLAAAMREIAARHNVVVVRNPALTRRLFRATAIDDALPSDFHAEVARIIVWVFAARQQRAAAGAAA
ncbi:MAG: type secretion exporter [Ramlibacter sp.]|nr:type secretion exporter [Ramlibacter sp.]